MALWCCREPTSGIGEERSRQRGHGGGLGCSYSLSRMLWTAGVAWAAGWGMGRFLCAGCGGTGLDSELGRAQRPSSPVGAAWRRPGDGPGSGQSRAAGEGGQTGGVQMGCRLQSELAITVVAQGVAGFADGSAWGAGARAQGCGIGGFWSLREGGWEEVFRVQI